jgi:hypothetical protein
MAGTLVDTNVLNAGVMMGMNALREHLALAKIVNANKGNILPMGQGEVVKVAIPAAVTTVSVTSDVVPPAVTAVTPTSESVTVDQWNAAPFAMEDKAVYQIGAGMVPPQLSEAAKSLANTIDEYLWGLLHSGSGIYGYAGTAATTPFATDLASFYAANEQADDQLMPVDNRYMLINAAAKAQALGLSVVQNAAFRGGGDHFVRGQIGELGGAEWVMSQNVPSHTAGTDNGATLTNATGTAGDVSIACDTGSGTFEAGDIISFASHDQTYIVKADVADVSSGTITFAPALVAGVTNSTLITLRATHRVNTLMHRDCIAFSMASLEGTAMTASSQANQAIAIDQESGLALRLKITEQYYQTQWAFDALYGGVVARRELGVRIGG